jgi:hypothetical protein
MARTATPLNITTQPGVGMGYVVRNVKTKKFVRVSTTCQRDLNRKGSKIKVLRAFSGAEPFFTAKIGSLNTDIEVLKFLCGESHKKCLDSTGTYEWTGISLADARKDKMEFAEPGYVAQEEAVVAKPKKTKPAKAKKVKAPKAKTVKKVKASKPKKAAPAADVTPAAAPVITAAVETPVVAEVVAPVQKQTADEFAAEIDAAFAADLKKNEAAATA